MHALTHSNTHTCCIHLIFKIGWIIAAYARGGGSHFYKTEVYIYVAITLKSQAWSFLCTFVLFYFERLGTKNWNRTMNSKHWTLAQSHSDFEIPANQRKIYSTIYTILWRWLISENGNVHKKQIWRKRDTWIDTRNEVICDLTQKYHWQFFCDINYSQNSIWTKNSLLHSIFPFLFLLLFLNFPNGQERKKKRKNASTKHKLNVYTQFFVVVVVIRFFSWKLELEQF